MAIEKAKNGWRVDIQPAGRGGKRFRKTLRTQAEAKAYEAWVKTKAGKDKAWKPERRDERRLSDLVEAWWSGHGKSLKAGHNTHERLQACIKAMGDPYATELKAEHFAAYRAERMESGKKAATLNREHAYLRAVFNECERLGIWDKPNPLEKIRQIKIDQAELTYLTPDQIIQLRDTLKGGEGGHALLVTDVCLSCGARWGEAEALRRSQVQDGLIQFAGTKSGKVRSIPIEAELQARLLDHWSKQGIGDALFRPCYGAFRAALKRSGIELPEGQMTHVLRHTFASAFMQAGGNILVLQRALGHQSLTMTMRYAHLAPDHLEQVKRLNPLSALLTLG
jgi:integrase